MRRVLVISPHFPPDSTAATHRARLLAPRLPEHGWQPTVLTVDPAGYEGPLDPALAASVPESLEVVRVPAWPPALTRRVGFGDLGLRAFTALGRGVHALMSRRRFDAAFITIYPTYPALLGPMMKRRFGIPFVLDYQDPWVGEWGRTVGPRGAADTRSRASRWLATRLEPIALRQADGVTAVSTATFDQALSRYGLPKPKAVAELPIGWDERDLEWVERAEAARPIVANRDGLIHAVYVGTLLPTGFDTLHAFCAGWSAWRAREPRSAERLRLHLFGTSNQRSGGAPRALPLARGYGLDDLITEHPNRLDYFEALRTLREAHAVLLLGSREPHYTPSKLFPAMLSGRPIVAIYHETSTAVDLLQAFGGPPAVRLITFAAERPVETTSGAIATALCELVRRPCYSPADVDRRVLVDVSAPALARRLAAVLDRVAR